MSGKDASAGKGGKASGEVAAQAKALLNRASLRRHPAPPPVAASNKWTSPSMSLARDVDIAALRERNKVKFAEGAEGAFTRRDPVLRGGPSPHRPTNQPPKREREGESGRSVPERQEEATESKREGERVGGPVALKRPRSSEPHATSQQQRPAPPPALPPSPSPSLSPRTTKTSSKKQPLPSTKSRPSPKKTKISALASKQLDALDALLDEEEVDIEI